MAKRLLKPPTSPEALGLFVSLLARYANDAPDKTELELKFESALREDPNARAVAKQLVDNFKRIPISLRVTHLRDLAEPMLTGFQQARFETSIKAMPVVAVNTVALADDVRQPQLPENFSNELITLNFSGIYCSDDTDDHFFGSSDEIFVITNTVVVINGVNIQRDETHPKSLGNYEGVEIGEFRHGPLAACWQGGPNIVSLVCTVMEHDFGDPDHYKKQIALIVTTAFAVIGILNPAVKLIALLAAIEVLLIEAINWLIDTEDDMIGDPKISVIEVDQLRRMAREEPRLFVGEHRELVSLQPVKFETVKDTTEILHHFATTHSGAGGKYNVCFRLKLDILGVVAPV